MADSRLSKLSPLVAVLVGLCLTSVATYLTQQYTQQVEAQRFERLTDRIAAAISQRIQAQTTALYGLRALFMVENTVSREKFRAFTTQYPPEQYPGAIGFGYIQRIPHADVSTYVARQRQSGAPEFAMRSLHNDGDHFPFTYIEPIARNAPALGLDLAFEAHRVNVLQESAARGFPTISDSIRLVQDPEGRVGFLLVLPIQRVEARSRVQRVQITKDWVSTAVVIDDLLAGVTEETEHLVDFELYEHAPYRRDNLLFDADGHVPQITLSGESLPTNSHRQRRHRQLVELPVAGQTWFLDVSTNANFNASHVSQAPPIVFAVGLIISVLAGGLFGTSRRTLIKANALAEEMTASLRRKEAEMRDLLRDLERQQEALNEHCIVAMTDTQGTIHYVNRKFCEISGYTEAELIGNNHRILRTAEHDNAFWKSMYQTIAHGGIWQGEICNRAKDGHSYWVNSTIVPFLNAQGKPIRYMAMRTDITELKRIQNELTEHRNHLQDMVAMQTADLIHARDAAESANRAKNEFISNMSHEMRTPLHGIMALADMGSKRFEKLPPEKIGEYFKRIHQSGQRLLDLVVSVLELAQQERGTGPANLHPTDLIPLIHEVIRSLDGSARVKRQSVRLEAGNAPSVALLDPAGIKLVLHHLIHNAIRYSPEEGVIRLRLLPATLSGGAGERPAIAIEVQDNGPGIPAGELEEIFKDFTQGSHTRTGAGGVGLGLGVSRRIIASHGGHLWARNNPDGGATLTFTLAQPGEALIDGSSDPDYPAGNI